jgi:hypothetical protein
MAKKKMSKEEFLTMIGKKKAVKPGDKEKVIKPKAKK